MILKDNWEDTEYIYNVDSGELEIKYEGDHLLTFCPASLDKLLTTISEGMKLRKSYAKE